MKARTLIAASCGTGLLGAVAGAGLALTAPRVADTLEQIGVPASTRATLRAPADWVRAPELRLRSVEFVGLELLEPEKLVQFVGLESSLPLWDLDPERIAARVEQHPRVERAAAVRVPPDALLIEVEERVPIALHRDHPGGPDAFDARGACFPLWPGEGDGLIEVRGEPVWALDLLEAAPAAGIEIASVEARGPNDVSFRQVGDATRIRIRSGAAGLPALTDLGGVLERRHAREVDLRFAGEAVLRGVGATREGGAGDVSK